jgi:4-amino-4-deoxy-L-arabinose transferase-like glycosyltransferase
MSGTMDHSTSPPPARHAEPAFDLPRRATAIAGLALGAVLYLFFTRGHEIGFANLAGLGLIALLFVLPGVGKRLNAILDRVRHLGARELRLVTVGVFIVVTVYLFVTATRQARDMFPTWHDQQMTMIQTQMLARGKLWMASHPCADFFETFYVFVKPVYAAMYFPGAALFFVPGVWLHLPYAVMPLVASGLLAALLFRVISELIDPVAGLAGVLMLVSMWVFRLLSLWVMSHTVFTLLALWAVWSWMQWRKEHGAGWAASLGVALGWMAITRPVDALAYGIPLGLAVLWELRKKPLRAWGKSPVIIILTACPFLSLQLVQDKGITGKWLKTPIQYYDDQELPGASAYGGQLAGNFKATSALLQKQRYEEDFILATRLKYARASWGQVLRQRVQSLLNFTLPSAPKSSCSRTAGVLIVLLPVGLLWALRDARRMVLVAPSGLFIVGYMLYPEVLDHYVITAAPGVILAVLGGGVALADAWPKLGRTISSAISLAAIALAVTSLPEFHLDKFDDDSWAAISFNYDVLPTQVQKPALVLYRYWKLKAGDTERNFNDEPVYNVDVAWPDDASIIRAHDLGARDTEIIEYYGRTQPDRNVYLVDRAELPDLQAHMIGKAGDLAKRIKEGGGLPSELNAR